MARSHPRQFATAPPPEARAPDGVTIYAIGDLHGRADLLKLLIEEIRSDHAGKRDRAELIFLGDYIDRGPDSDAVIDQVIELQDDQDFSVTALKGNHESVALQFLADPTVGQLWCSIGGRSTLLSYGVRPPVSLGDMEHWEAARQAFQAALPAMHLSFLRRLQTHAERGDYVFVHAGLRPRVGLAEQREWDMLWIRNEFLNHRGGFEKVVVHGHTPEEQPFVGSDRIGIDTGADVTNRLTGLKLAGAERQIISVNGAPIRFSRAANRNMCQVPRPLPAKPCLPTSPKISPVSEAGIAPIPWWRAKSVRARISAATPAGLVALVAIGYLAVPPSDGELLVDPPEAGSLRNEQPGRATLGTNRKIEDIIARADKALHAATGANVAAPTTITAEGQQMELADVSMPPVSHLTPNHGAETSRIQNSNPDPPDSVPVRQLPDRGAPEDRTAVEVTPSSNRTSGAAHVAAQAASRIAAADRKAVAPATPREAAASKPVPPDGPQSDMSRAALSADRPKEPAPSKDARLAQGTVSAALDGKPIASDAVAYNDSLNPRVSSEQEAAYIGAVPVKSVNRIGPLDYLDASIRADEQGVVGVRYVINTSGRVSACSATKSSNFARLDKRTCELIVRRFRFKPAIRNGRPVEDVREQRIRWAISE